MSENNMFSPDEINNFTEILSTRLKPKRFQHSMRVAYLSAYLAPFYGIDVSKATVTGLLHDIAKEILPETQIKMCDENGIVLSETERELPHLIHGKLGAFILKQEFNITDPDILNAITYHTVGRPDMSNLEKIIFSADFLEPGREFTCNPSLNDLRLMIFTDIDKAVAYILKNTFEYLNEKSQKIDTSSLNTYNWYKRFL